MTLRTSYDVLDGNQDTGTPSGNGAPTAGSGIKSYDLEDFLSLGLPPRRYLLEPVLRERDLALVHAPRGLGKSWLAANLGLAISSGKPILGWEPPEPAGVLLIDGEMAADELQQRYSALKTGAGYETAEPLRIIAADLTDYGIPNLETEEGQQAVEQHLDGIKLIILDNLSSLFASEHNENESSSWEAPQRWLLRLRREGYAVVVIHHSGKTGAQRGTSRREDVLNIVMGLRRPAEYRADDGCRFELHFEKARGVKGGAVAPLMVSLDSMSGGLAFSYRTLDESNEAKVRELVADGMTNNGEIGKTLDLDRSTVWRIRKRLKI